MYSFRELRKGVKIKVAGKERRLAVLGNCATQFFSTAVTGYARLSNINLKVYDADYNQISEQLLSADSEVYQFVPDMILLWLATDKLYEEFLDRPRKERLTFADEYMEKMRWYWSLIEKNSNAKILQMNFTEINDKVLGQYSAKVESTFTYQIRKLNYLLQEAMGEAANVYPVDLLSEQIKLGQRTFYEASYYYNARMSISVNALPYVAKAVTDVIKSINGIIKKCAILDLDNTLWGGIVGDDGVNNIEIGELGRGRVFSNLQRWLKQLKEYGILLAVCSKNDEETAREPFEVREDMILKREDIAAFVANWNDKPSNIRLIQEIFNIGMDSFVFIDDNPFERELVRQTLPEVEVPELPPDPAEYLEFLQNENDFDTVSFTENLADRTKFYREEFDRKKTENTFTSIEEYLDSLQMIGSVLYFEEEQIARIAQLTQRSNQFNLRTVRYGEEEIRRIKNAAEYVGLSYTLRDKFGNHGLVGVTILRKDGGNAFIDTWLMSCRVLKKSMEEFVMNQLMEKAAEHGIRKVTGEYIPSSKNKMVKNIYREMGFMEIRENFYEIEVKNYRMKKTYIRKG